MAASATFALKAGVWFRRGRLLMVSPDSLGTACPLSGRNSTYRPVQISGAGSHHHDRKVSLGESVASDHHGGIFQISVISLAHQRIWRKRCRSSDERIWNL